jgi:transposase-like protein
MVSNKTKELIMSLDCKKCSSSSFTKNGFVGDVQRYKCKNCGYNYVEGDKRQKYTTDDRLKVIKLYLENCGLRSIERLTGIRHSQISQWIIDAADYIKEELNKASNSVESLKDIEVLEIDELCTYIKKNPKMEGSTPLYGLLLIETKTKLLILK